MQIGVDSFAAAFDETSQAVNPSDRLRDLIEQIEHADQVGLTYLELGNTTAGSFSIPLPRSFWERRRHEPSASVSRVPLRS